MTILEAALKYESMGYSVIPVATDKRPIVKWEPFQKVRADEKQIREWDREYPTMNIAIITGAISGLTVIDCDSQEAIKAFEEMTWKTFYTPMQNTPRGGRHFVCKYAEDVRNKAAVIDHMDVRSEGGYIVVAPSRNRDGKPYAWVDGYEPWTLPPAPVPPKVLELLKGSNVFSMDTSISISSTAHARSNYGAMFREGHRDNDLYYTAQCLSDGRMAVDKIAEVIEILAQSCDPPFPANQVLVKVKSAMDRTQRKERNLSQEVRDWVLSSSGIFLSSDVIKAVGLSSSSSRTELQNVSNILGRLRDEGLIVKEGNKRGCFRTLDQEVEAIDFVNAPTEEFKIHLPFEIERFVKIFPKNIIVVAGEPNAGKTALLMNIALENQAYHETHVFSSEQGPVELNERLSKFDFPLKDWTAKFWERSSDFPDVIRPDALNIIDFLELHDRFWEISGIMKQIHDRLNKGIAVIALQKNPTRKAKDGTVSGEVGLGGFRGLEKPRLYLTMSIKNVIKIVKAKNWRTEFNPNGYAVRYSLARGCVFRQKGKWTKGEDLDLGDFVHEED
ncbi:MAG: bifunctional DNA primase/polymerase [Syntrophales bacterium]|nr:bifunctional DNA primase/polymerase [Syntrophales bacterium]